MKKSICYSIWGNKSEYTHGIEKNFKLIQRYFPDWKMVVYFDKSVPNEYVNNNDEIEWIKIKDNSFGAFWRFNYINKCDVFLSRDLDSRISEREVYCVNKWLNSEFKFLSIRDKIPEHYEWKYMAGMFGIKNGIDEEDIQIMNKYKEHHFYTADQQYLQNHIYRKYKNQTLFLGPKEDQYLKNTWNDDFIGQGYYEDDSFRYNPQTGKIIPRITKNKLVLFQSYYNPKDEGRRKEIEYCLNKNLNNPSINKVVLFLDDDSVEYPTHDKIDTYINTEGQLTYEKVFRYAQKLYSDQLCILINNDIFLDYNSFKDLTEIENLINNNIVFSLSRHEYDVSTEKGIMDESFSRMLFAHTQDAWIWKSNFIPENSNFNLGTLGCDNAINDRFKKSGKVPLNLGSKYKVYHVDQVRGKTSTNKFSKEKHAEFHDFNRETYPEERGQFLTPDYGMTLNMSLDDFSKQLGFNQIDRYELICEMMSKKIKIKNR